MLTIQIREKIQNYISSVDDKKIMAIYELMKNEIDSTKDIWESKEFLALLNKRLGEYENKTTKLFSLEDIETRARKAFAKIKR